MHLKCIEYELCSDWFGLKIIGMCAKHEDHRQCSLLIMVTVYVNICGVYKELIDKEILFLPASPLLKITKIIFTIIQIWYDFKQKIVEFGMFKMSDSNQIWIPSHPYFILENYSDAWKST